MAKATGVILILFIPMMCQAVALAQQGPPPGSYEMLTEAGAAIIPFEIHRQLIVVTGEINGVPVKLHLDTGFPNDGVMLMSSPEVDGLNLSYLGKAQVGGAGGDELILSDLAMGQVINFPGVHLTDQTIIVMPYDSLRNRSFSDVNGTIGGSFFNHLVVTIDYDQKQLVVSEPDKFKYSGSGRELALGIREDLARTVDAVVEMNDGTVSGLRVVVDLGNSRAFSINVNACEGIDIPEKAIEYSLGVGLAGEEVGHIGRIKRLTLGDLILNNVVTCFSTSQWLEAIEGQGNLGNETLQRFRVIFDYAHNRMILEPNRRYGEPFEFNMSGVGLKKIDNGYFRVAAVVPDSPGSEAGFRIDDLVTAINGRSADLIHGDELSAMLCKPGKTMVFTVMRADSTMELKVKLRRLI